jgi:hypothetical protein
MGKGGLTLGILMRQGSHLLGQRRDMLIQRLLVVGDCSNRRCQFVRYGCGLVRLSQCAATRIRRWGDDRRRRVHARVVVGFKRLKGVLVSGISLLSTGIA